MSVITKAAIIYMKIYLAYEEHVYKTPTQHNVSMANALQRYVERQTTTIRHNTMVAGQLGLKSSRPASQVGLGSTRPGSTRPGVDSIVTL